MRNNLYVGNLASTDDRDLKQLLSRFGIVRFAAVLAGHGADRGGRFGVVEMQSDSDARAAIRALDGFEIRGGNLTVRWATAAEQTACGHPAMFGTMNVSGLDEHEGTPPTGPVGQHDTPTR